MKFYKKKTNPMKFYNYNNTLDYYAKIRGNKLTSIFISYYKTTMFFKNGKYNNTKNAAYITYNGYKKFYLNDKLYGYHYNFTKESWRRFVKLQAFL
jgi:hypothetical protein